MLRNIAPPIQIQRGKAHNNDPTKLNIHNEENIMTRYIVKPSAAYGARIFDTWQREYVGGIYPDTSRALTQAHYLNDRDESWFEKHVAGRSCTA
jgi:hypothetical protein